VVSVRFRAAQFEKRGSVIGIRPEARLSLVYDANGTVLQVPKGGLVLSTMLAKLLDVKVGDKVEVEVLEGRRPALELPVVQTFETYIGTPAYIHLDNLGRSMRELDVINVVHLRVDPALTSVLYKELRENPGVAAVTLREAAVRTFQETMDETIMVFVTFFSVFAGALTFGTIYNTARISLSERQRELATLRVLGATRASISYILLGEVALVTVLALPLGCFAGYGLASLMTAAFETELYRVPFIIKPSSYGIAVVFGIGVTLMSAIWVRRSLDKLDLIAVLKTRD